MLIDTDVNSRFHSCTLNWIPVILLPSAKQTTTKYEQVLYWRHTCIILFSCFVQKVLEYIHGLPATFQKLINCIIRGMEQAGGVVIIDLEIWIIDEYMYLREQGWRSGESTRLPPMWPGFKSQRRRHMWVEFVVGSLPYSKRFFSGYSGFPLSSKTNTFKFQFDLECVDTFKRVHMNS